DRNDGNSHWRSLDHAGADFKIGRRSDAPARSTRHSAPTQEASALPQLVCELGMRFAVGADNFSGELEIAHEPFSGIVARAQHACEPADVAGEVLATDLEILGGPAQEPLVVVHAPRKRCVPVSLAVVGELEQEAAADLV